MPPARAAPRLVGRSCPELERTSLGPQALPQNLRPFSQMRREDQKNRTRIGPHLRQARRARSQVISVAKIGYVRWSEFWLGILLDAPAGCRRRLADALRPEGFARRQQGIGLAAGAQRADRHGDEPLVAEA